MVLRPKIFSIVISRAYMLCLFKAHFEMYKEEKDAQILMPDIKRGK
jgi:hypothetical protein